jgi:hypothetical protein
MESKETDPLRERLEKVEHRLEAALGEVCDDPSQGGVRKPNTGELIRIDETLTLASAAAKQAISLRRQRAKKDQVEEESQPTEAVE